MKVGIQLYSVRQSFKENPAHTLEALAKTGYRYIEAANHNGDTDDGVGFGVPAKALRKTLADVGLEIVGCHVGPLIMDRLDAIIAYHTELGNTRIGGDLEIYPYGDMDALNRTCDFYNAVGEKLRAAGIQLYYHNHYQEFQTFVPGGETVYDYVMAHTDPALLKIELDTYWVARAGQDVVRLMDKHSDRLILLHQKDFPKDAPQPLSMYDGIINPTANISMDVFSATKNPACFTEIGTGTLPIQSYIDAGNRAPGVEYIILEQDNTKLDELESIRVSMEAFRRFDGLQW